MPLSPLVMGLLAGAPVHAADLTSQAWTAASVADPVELTTKTITGRADTEGRGALLVDCSTGAVFIDVGAPLDLSTSGRATFRIRFENDPAARDLKVKGAFPVPSMATVDEPRFAATLATREVETLHVAPTMLGAHRTYSFELNGTAAAFVACGLDLAALPAPVEASIMPAPSEDDPTAGIVGGVVGPVIVPATEGVRVFHHSELRIRTRVAPKYPEEAIGLPETAANCRVRVFIDAEGLPVRLEVENCPAVFHAALEDALMQWTWYPATIDGVPVPAQFLIAIKFMP